MDPEIVLYSYAKYTVINFFKYTKVKANMLFIIYPLQEHFNKTENIKIGMEEAIMLLLRNNMI